MIAAVAALLALATASDPPPPPEVAQAGEAFGSCISGGLDRADAALRPEAAADAILAGCRTQQEAMSASHARWVQASALSAREKAQSLRAARRNLQALRGQLIRHIRDARRR